MTRRSETRYMTRRKLATTHRVKWKWIWLKRIIQVSLPGKHLSRAAPYTFDGICPYVFSFSQLPWEVLILFTVEEAQICSIFIQRPFSLILDLKGTFFHGVRGSWRGQAQHSAERRAPELKSMTEFPEWTLPLTMLLDVLLCKSEFNDLNF